MCTLVRYTCALSPVIQVNINYKCSTEFSLSGTTTVYYALLVEIIAVVLSRFYDDDGMPLDEEMM